MQSGWRSGPRLRDRPPSGKECWRCAADDRVLRVYALVIAGKLVGSIQLCGPCAGSATPLNPDPLDATQAA